jgi:hypothetical protein
VPQGKLTVFISSGLKEFARERYIIELVLSNNPYLEAIRLEKGAYPATTRDRSLEAARECDVYLGIFGTKFSQLTADEFREANRYGKPCFAYISGDSEKDAPLNDFIKKELDVEVSRYRFKDHEDLGRVVSADLQKFVGEVLGLGLSQWIVQNNKGGVKSIEAKIERNIADVAKLIPVSPVLGPPAAAFTAPDAPISVVRKELSGVMVGRAAPTWVIISMELVNGPRRGAELRLLELPSTSVWLRLAELQKMGRIMRFGTRGLIEYDLTSLGVIALAGWIVKHKMGTPTLKSELDKLTKSKPEEGSLF